MKCFGSCRFLCGLWMDISGAVANFPMRTDAKNLLTTARTIHLPEQMETIHMISMLNRLAGCSTKASPKAETLITAVKTWRLLDVDIHPNCRTLMEHKAFLST